MGSEMCIRDRSGASITSTSELHLEVHGRLEAGVGPAHPHPIPSCTLLISKRGIVHMDLSPDNWLFVAPFQTSLDMEPLEAFKLQVRVHNVFIIFDSSIVGCSGAM